MVPERDLLAEHAAVHRDGDERLIGIGRCRSTVTGDEMWGRMLRVWWEDAYAGLLEPDHPWTWIDFAAGNSSLSRSLLDVCGGFDETFRRRNEEMELGVRLVRAGARFRYLPRATAWHHLETNFEMSLGDVRRQAYYDVLLFQKHPQLRRRVFIASWFKPNGRMRAKPAVAYQLLPVAERLLGPASRVARALECLKMRRTWYKLTDEIRATAYLQGLRDADARVGPSNRPARRLLGASASEGDQILRATLGERGVLRVSTEGREPHVALYLGDQELAHLPAMRIGRSWDWDDLIERATAACVGPLRQGLGLEELRDLVAGPGGDAVTGS
jgi:hypothetical protein